MCVFLICPLATSCHYKANHVRLRWLDIENDATFHRNQDFGDVNNKLEKVMQVLDDQIVFVVPHLHSPIVRVYTTEKEKQ